MRILLPTSLSALPGVPDVSRRRALVRLAKPDALVMHCLPAHRGQEIDAATLEANADTIFDQSENRLHVQKAILATLEGEAVSVA